jgi:hypothetical protein
MRAVLELLAIIAFAIGVPLGADTLRFLIP